MLVTDLRSGVTATDLDVATLLQKCGKPIVLCVNKCDSVGEPPMAFYEFYNLGWATRSLFRPPRARVPAICSTRATSISTLSRPRSTMRNTSRWRSTVRPNVGKSSLVNRMAGEERVIVSNVCRHHSRCHRYGVENEHGKFVSHRHSRYPPKGQGGSKPIERYSVLRAYMAVDRSDVCVIVIETRSRALPTRTARLRAMPTSRARAASLW